MRKRIQDSDGLTVYFMTIFGHLVIGFELNLTYKFNWGVRNLMHLQNNLSPGRRADEMESIYYNHAILIPLGYHVWIDGNTIFLTVFFSLKHTKKLNAIL